METMEGPRTVPPDTFIAKHPGRCSVCNEWWAVGDQCAYLYNQDIKPGEKDLTIHFRCWRDREWEVNTGMKVTEWKGVNDWVESLDEYDQPVVKETVDPLLFTKAKLQDKPVTKQMIDERYNSDRPVDRELVHQIGAVIESLTDIRRELHQIYKKLHHPYYGQD